MKRIVGVLVFLSCCFGSFSQDGCPLGDWDDVVVFCTDENDLGIKYPATTQQNADFCFFRDLYGALMDSTRFSDENSFQSLSGVVGCLGYNCIVPPKWLLMQVEESGDLTLELTHSGNSDVDYACWGPFWGDTKNDVLRTICEDPVSSLSFIPQYRVLTQEDLNLCPNLSSMTFTRRSTTVDDMLTQVDNPCFRGNFDRYPYMNLQDCSFSYQYTEMCRIDHAEEGGWYLFMVSNYGRMLGNITVKKLGGSAIVSCRPIVDVSNTGPYCEGDDIQLKVLNVPENASFSWLGPNGFSSTEKDPVIHNSTIADAGIYTLQMVANGVSSDIVETDVIVRPSVDVDTTIILDFGESYRYDDSVFTETGVHTEVDTANPCAVKNVHLFFSTPETHLKSNSPICEGEALVLSVEQIPNAQYDWIVPSGQRLQNQSHELAVPDVDVSDGGSYQLDMIIHADTFSYQTVVDVHKKQVVMKDTMVVAGGSVEFAGEMLREAGEYQGVFQGQNGCDSVVVLHLDYYLPEITLVTNAPVCEGEELTIQADGETGGASIEWIGPDGFSSDQKSISIPNVSARNQGEYKLIRRYADTLVETSIMALVREKYSEEVDVTISKGDEYDFGGELLSVAGDYKKTFISQNGCDSIVTIHLTVIFPDTSLNILTDNPYCSGETIRLRVEPQYDYAEYRWNGPQHFLAVGPEVEIENVSEYNGGSYSVVMTVFDEEVRRSVDVDVYATYFSDTAITVPYGSTYDFQGTRLDHSGIYKTTLLSADGCDSTIYLDLTVLDYEPLKPAKYFSPNGDGVNERWVIENVEKYDQVEVTIFDRYGAVVRHYDHYENQMGWDGKDENGFDKPSTDYWYIISVPYLREELSGNFSLIRR